MQGVHFFNDKVHISNDKNIVQRAYKTGEVAYFQLNKKAMLLDCFILNNEKVVERYTFHPIEKRMKGLDALVKFVCERFEPFLKDKNIDNLIKQIYKKAVL